MVTLTRIGLGRTRRSQARSYARALEHFLEFDRGLRASVRVLGQEPTDDGPRFSWDLVEVRRLADVRHQDFGIRAAFEGWNTREKLVSDDPEGVQV
jgi:hypothetical protein